MDEPLLGALLRGHELLPEAKTSAAKPPYQYKLIRLALLVPESQKMILQGRQPAGLTLAELLRSDFSAGLGGAG